MLTLTDLFELQATMNKRVGLDDQFFARHFGDAEGTAFDPALVAAGKWIDDMLKAMSNEIEELRDCTFWKHWCQEAQRGERYRVNVTGSKTSGRHAGKSSTCCTSGSAWLRFLACHLRW